MTEMHKRKADIALEADAFIALPVGYGATEEVLEMITWSQVRIRKKPVLVEGNACSRSMVFNRLSFLNALNAPMRDKPQIAIEIPEDVASRFTFLTFDNPQAVLAGARHMAARLAMSRHHWPENTFMASLWKCNNINKSIVEGKLVIVSHNKLARIKWLKDKPLAKFEDALQ